MTKFNCKLAQHWTDFNCKLAQHWTDFNELIAYIPVTFSRTKNLITGSKVLQSGYKGGPQITNFDPFHSG
jgi:hypothetical protein